MQFIVALFKSAGIGHEDRAVATLDIDTNAKRNALIKLSYRVFFFVPLVNLAYVSTICCLRSGYNQFCALSLADGVKKLPIIICNAVRF